MSSITLANMFLGRTVTDKITGFTGICIGFVAYLTGCNQALVAPKVVTEGKPADALWFDQQRLEIDVETPALVFDNGPTPGADLTPPGGRGLHAAPPR